MAEQSVIVRFVKVANDPQKLMEKAFVAVGEIDSARTWFSEKECLQIKKKDKHIIYVFDDFVGQAFFQVASTGNRIYGPSCILHCLKNEEVLPKLSRPVFSKAMKGLIISCTSLTAEIRDVLHQKVEWMMGETSKDFHEKVTHLVAGEVGSKKYTVAASLKKKIMTPEWVNAVWNESRTTHLHGSDEQFDKYQCPMFKGLFVSVSGLDVEERTRIKSLIEEGGGKYSGEMKLNECTHLILKSATGQKYQFARKWKINTIFPQWMYDSINAGYCLEESKYNVAAEKDNCPRAGFTSTPTGENSEVNMTSLSNISSISVTHINDTELQRRESMMSSLMSVPTQLKPRSSSIDSLDSLDLRFAAATCDSFLDGCKIFISGVSGARLEKVRNIINRGGGTRFNQINESISHVIVGDVVEETVKRLQQATFRPHIVELRWLVECFKQGRRVPEEPFRCLDFLPPQTMSPQVKTHLKKSSDSSEKPVKASAMSEAQKESNMAADKTLTQTEMADKEMHTLLSQYLPMEPSDGGLGESTLMRAADIGEAMEAGNRTINMAADNDATMFVQPDCVKPNENDDTRDVSMLDVDDALDHLLFHRKTFVMFEFDMDDEITVLIRENGGTILPVNTKRVADYAVVPVCGCPVSITVSEIVTNAWVQMCVEEGDLLPLESKEIFTPVTLIPNCTPLVGCILSISGYSGVERDVLLNILELLGGKCQDYFVRRAKDSLLPSTHLVVNAAEGPKYNAAKKWGLPAVTKRWVFECARLGKRVKEDLYFVDNASPEKEVVERIPEYSNRSNPQPDLTVAATKRSIDEKNESFSAPPKKTKKSNENDIGESAEPVFKQPAPIETESSEKKTLGRRVTRSSRSSSVTSNEDSVPAKKEEVPLTRQRSAAGKEKTSAPVKPSSDIVAPCPQEPAAKEDLSSAKLLVPSVEDSSVPNKKKLSRKDNSASANLANNRNIGRSVENEPTSGDTNRKAEELSLGEKDSRVLPAAPTRSPDNVEPMDVDGQMSRPSKEFKLNKLPDFNLDQNTTKKGGMIETANQDAKPDAPIIQNIRVKELIKDSKRVSSPSPNVLLSTSLDETNAGVDTPSRFLGGEEYQAKFDLKNVMNDFLSPVVTPRTRQLRTSLLLEEVFAQNINIAVKNSVNGQPNNDSFSQEVQDEGYIVQDNTAKPLVGVVIYVGKKLTKNQSEYNHIAEELGGTYVWEYKSHLTHFIFQGRANDTNKEFRMARDQQKIIVSPYWLMMCQEQNCRVEESLFPHTFNPSMSLSITSHKTPRPIRTAAHINPAASQSSSNCRSYEETTSSVSTVVTNDTSVTVVLANKEKEETFESFNTTQSDEDIAKACGNLEDQEQKTQTNALLDGLKRLNEAATKTNGRGKHLTRLHSSTDKESLDGSDNPRSRLSRNGSRDEIDDRSLASKPLKTSKSSSKLPHDLHTQPSQIVEVTWDDPVAREQREMLASDLAKNSEPFSPIRRFTAEDENVRQNPAEVLPTRAKKDAKRGVDLPSNSVAAKPGAGNEQPLNAKSTASSEHFDEKKKTKTSASRNSPVKSTSVVAPSTVAPPTIAPPIVAPPTIAPPTVAPPTVAPPTVAPAQTKLGFMFSGLSQQERDDYTSLVERLGGVSLDSANYNSNCSHLIVQQPTRNEKYLACVAAGKWVLHKSYLEACREAGVFLEEEKYEWGSLDTAEALPNPTIQQIRLAEAAHRWRLHLSDAREKGKGVCGAFTGWRCMLLTDNRREDGFRRLLESGSAIVVPNSSPLSFDNVTHAFIDLNKLKFQLDLTSMVKAGVHCLKPEYIASYLTDDPKPSPSNFYIPEVQQLINTDENRKRKVSDESSISSKKSKR